MSRDDEALVRRALAAARKEREKREAEERQLERRRETEKERQKAARAAKEWELKVTAAKKLEEILGRKISPHDWSIEEMQVSPSPYGVVSFAVITLLGVAIRGTDEKYMTSSSLEVKVSDKYGGEWSPLTLASFGEMLEKLHGEPGR